MTTNFPQDRDRPNEAEDQTVDVDPNLTISRNQSAPAEVPDAIPARIGRYPVQRELGRGGMGVVYLATDPSLDRPIALKRLPRAVATDPVRLNLFRQEARLLASLNHPNIATIHSLEDADDMTFLTMEAIEGETLRARLSREPLKLNDSLRVGRQIARALETAHKKGVVHRDLKPANVMFDASGNAKVLDFGLAAPARGLGAGPEQLEGTGSQSGEVSGTPGYMSPEQISGAPSDPRMDIWAFGCVLYECLCGSRAIGGTTLRDRLRNTYEAKLDVGRLPTGTPDSLVRVLANCLKLDPDSRPLSMTEPRRVIEELLAGSSLGTLSVGKTESQPSTPHNLPRHASTFVGRRAELESVERLLDEHRLVTLTGIGGGGKTRLALRVAESELPRHPDGVWLVGLAPLSDADDVARALMKAIGIPNVLDRSELDTIIDYLSGKKTMLVVDNCEHVLEGAADVVGRLLRDLPDLRLLVTSRERLNIAGESVFPIPLLHLPDAKVTSGATENLGYDLQEVIRSDAVELFLQRGRQVGANIEINDTTVGPIVEICRRLDGIPLAIEMAASRLKVLPVAEVARRMDDRFKLLKGSARDEQPQHRTLRALIDWSYEQLGPEEQTLLNRLSIFAAGWTLESAEDVTVGGLVKDWDVLDLISRLVDKSIIETDLGSTDGASRFRMLETVRAYANEQLEQTGESAQLQKRHREYFAAFTAKAEPELVGSDQAQWYSKIAAEHEEIRRAFESCRNPEVDPMVGLQMAGSLFRYWMVRGHWLEAEGWSREVLKRAEELPPTEHRAKTQNCVGVVELYRGNLEGARTHWQETFDEWAALESTRGMAAARLNLGNVAYSSGDYEAARRDYGESLERSRSLEQVDGICRCLISLGNVALATGKYEESRDYNSEVVELLTGQGHLELVAHALLGKGTAELRLENFEAARRHYERSLGIQRDLGDRRNAGIATINLAVVFQKLNLLRDAHTNFVDALETFCELGDVGSICSSLEGLAGLASELGRPEDMLILHGATNAIRKSVNLPRMPDEETTVTEAMDIARKELGAERAESLRLQGAEMELDAAVDWARGNTAPAEENGKDG